MSSGISESIEQRDVTAGELKVITCTMMCIGIINTLLKENIMQVSCVLMTRVVKDMEVVI